MYVDKGLSFARIFSKIFLKIIGWKAEGVKPDVPKYVMIGYPHTSNWDFPIGLMVMTALGIRLHWIGKDSLFHGPKGWLLKLLRGIPVNRSVSSNFVDNTINVFRENKEMVIVIAPEGTRSYTEFWRTGFYYIALGAGIPILLGFMDYSRKTGGVGPLFYPTGNIDQDLAEIEKFYAGKTGKFPEKMGEIKARPRPAS